jgi:hypothetical protein
MPRNIEDPSIRVRGNYAHVGSGPGWTPYTTLGWNVVTEGSYTYSGFSLVATTRTRVVIDPNVRVRGNGTYAGFEDVTGPITLHEPVEVYEPESRLVGQGQVTDIDADRELVYLSVDWSSLTEEAPQRQPSNLSGQALYISTGQSTSGHDWLELSAVPSLAYVSLLGTALQVTAPARGWWGEPSQSWAVSSCLKISQPYAELNIDRVVVE